MSFWGFRELGDLAPVHHRRDTEKYLEATTRPTVLLPNLSNTELLQLQIATTYVLAASSRRILGNETESKTKQTMAEQFFCNYSPFPDPIVATSDIRFWRIPNHLEIAALIPGNSRPEGSGMRRIGTWGAVGKRISEITTHHFKCQEGVGVGGGLNRLTKQKRRASCLAKL